MSMFIDSSGRLHHDQSQNMALNCPHCQVLARISPVSVPDFNQITLHKPSHVGLVYRCESCNSPLFLKFAVKLYGGSRVELSTSYSELERPPEKFNFTHLPEESERLFREALTVFSAGCYDAFASMCRRTAQAAFADLGEQGRLRIFDELAEIRVLAEIDDETFAVVKKVVFGNDAEARPNMPLVDGRQAGVLLEVMKDLLYQAYVRRGRLQQAMMMRRYFADEAATVTPIEQARG